MWKGVIEFALCASLMVLTVLAFAPQMRTGISTGQVAPKELKPIVLEVDHTEPDGALIVIPRAITVMRLEPTAPLAPVPPGTLMICRPYTDTSKPLLNFDGSNVLMNGRPIFHSNIGFRCGNDRYLVDTFDFKPKE